MPESTKPLLTVADVPDAWRSNRLRGLAPGHLICCCVPMTLHIGSRRQLGDFYHCEECGRWSPRKPLWAMEQEEYERTGQWPPEFDDADEAKDSPILSGSDERGY